MRIGLMGAWNVDSGAAIHTEILGRCLIELGHKVTVFTYLKESFHGTVILKEDEDYVYRSFSTGNAPSPKLNPIPFLSIPYEYFIAEDHGMFPLDALGKIFHWIKRKAKTITVIHDAELKEDPAFYQFSWDAIVCFDERYKEFLIQGYPKELVHIIPHPCLPFKPGDKETARKYLRLPLNKKIVFLFGQTAKFGVEIFPVLKRFAKSYPLKVLIVSQYQPTLKNWVPIAKKEKIVEIRKEAPGLARLYQYLYSADLFIYHKPSIPNKVTVASSIYQCLGSGCPIVALESNFTFPFLNSIMTYKDAKGFERWIESVFEEKSDYKEMLERGKKFIEKNSGVRVAQKFLELFSKLK